MATRGRPIGSIGASEQRLRKSIRELITPEQYEQIIQGLVDIALSSNSPKARVDATKLIIERIEGAVPTIIEGNVAATNINDILARANDE